MQINAENVQVLREWAEAYAEMGDRPQALEKYRQVLVWDSTNAALYTQMGELYRAEEQWTRAVAMYEGARRHATPPRPEIHQVLALLYRRLGRLEDALQESQYAVARGPDVPAHHEVFIDLHQRLGRCAEALELARTALGRWPADDALKARVDLLNQQCP